MTLACRQRHRCTAIPVGILASLLFAHAGQPSSATTGYTAYFSSSYAQARDKFLQSALSAGATIENFRFPGVGADGAPLYMDVAVIGPEDAESAIVLASGTHGVEGFAGSAVQTGLFREEIAERLPKNMRMVMIHAVNPYGFAHRRRFNEDNVDLNRSFVDHSTPHPENPGYEVLAEVLLPKSLSFWDTTRARLKLFWYRLTEGKLQLRKAISQGQFTHPEGLFFGGNAPTWSGETLSTIVTKNLAHAKNVVFIGVHTGLGEYGAAEVIMNVSSESPAYRRAQMCWGDRVRTTWYSESVSVDLRGTVKLAIPEMLPQSEVTAASLEFGTFPPAEVFWALRAENWLHHRGGPDYSKREEIKAELLRVFYPNEDAWKQSVWTEGKATVDQAIVCLTEQRRARGTPMDATP